MSVIVFVHFLFLPERLQEMRKLPPLFKIPRSLHGMYVPSYVHTCVLSLSLPSSGYFLPGVRRKWLVEGGERENLGRVVAGFEFLKSENPVRVGGLPKRADIWR